MPFKIGSTSSKPFRGSAAVKYMTVGSTLVQPDWTLVFDAPFARLRLVNETVVVRVGVPPPAGWHVTVPLAAIVRIAFPAVHEPVTRRCR